MNNMDEKHIYIKETQEYITSSGNVIKEATLTEEEKKKIKNNSVEGQLLIDTIKNDYKVL